MSDAMFYSFFKAPGEHIADFRCTNHLLLRLQHDPHPGKKEIISPFHSLPPDHSSFKINFVARQKEIDSLNVLRCVDLILNLE